MDIKMLKSVLAMKAFHITFGIKHDIPFTGSIQQVSAGETCIGAGIRDITADGRFIMGNSADFWNEAEGASLVCHSRDKEDYMIQTGL